MIYIHWFYINYEECKSDQTRCNRATEWSFILTMRNVNLLKKQSRFMFGKGFILTMRNVNLRIIKRYI